MVKQGRIKSQPITMVISNAGNNDKIEINE